jgi:solute carrier family 40 (iron-regulated transporter), member 1
VNVLSYGSIMLAYVTWRGMSPPTIGLTRGVSATIGLLGTIAYKYSSSKMSLENTGLWSIMMQAAFLGISYTSQFVDDDNTSLAMLVAGVCGSRVGLWR